MCVSIKNNWLAFDVVVAHAPHTWGTVEESPDVAHRKFWSPLKRVLIRRHREHECSC